MIKEHISIKTNNEDTAFATHILNNRHQYGQMEDIMDMRQWGKKKRHLFMQKIKFADRRTSSRLN
jgi:hypothetical protein